MPGGALCDILTRRCRSSIPSPKFPQIPKLARFFDLEQAGSRWTQLHCVVTGEIKLDNPEKIIRLQAVKARCGLSRSTLCNRMAAGEFPSPIALGARSVGWVFRIGNMRPTPAPQCG
ncbi:MAG: AlpA family phage regulatory protein [Terracidiphilus sp.]